MNDVYASVLELIDMRSFSNLWYWIALAVLWSTASHYVLGVPYDMVSRARKQGGAAMEELETLVRINVSRMLTLGEMAGLWLVALMCFLLSTLFSAGFFLGMEFAQAAFLLLFPMTIIWLLSLNTAKLIAYGRLEGEALCHRISRHRFHIQLLGMLFIFITALWGMYQNFAISVLR